MYGDISYQLEITLIWLMTLFLKMTLQVLVSEFNLFIEFRDKLFETKMVCT